MYALKKGVISIEESENFLYSPFTMKKLSQLELDEEVITLINLGCELENVERLIPDKLNHSIEEITNQSVKLLQNINRAKLPIKKWIDQNEIKLYLMICHCIITIKLTTNIVLECKGNINRAYN